MTVALNLLTKTLTITLPTARIYLTPLVRRGEGSTRRGEVLQQVYCKA